MKTITISGHNYSLRDFEDVKRDLQAFYEKHAAARIPSQQFLRDTDSSLYNQVRLWGYVFSGKLSPKYAIEKMGLETHTVITPEEIKQQFSSVFTREYIQKFNENPGNKISIKEAMTSAGRRQIQAYRACFSEVRGLNLQEIVNSLYPEHPRLYEELHGSALNHDTMSAALTKWYYEGKDLSPGSVERMDNLGSRIKHQLQKGIASDRGSDRYWHNMLEFLDMPRIDVVDIRTDGQDGRMIMSQIVEFQAQFILEIVRKYDPECTRMGDAFKRLFGPDIKHIYPRSNQELVTLKDSQMYADCRIQSGREDILLEAKNKVVLTDYLHTRLMKYSTKDRWNDNKRITRKVLLLNTIDDTIDGHSSRMINDGWLVWNTEQFLDDYKSAIRLLLEYDSAFFTTSQVPLHDAKFAIDIGEDVTRNPHILMRRSHSSRREWIKHFFRQNITGLTSGIKTHEREHYAMDYAEPFTVFDNYYHGRESVSVPGTLFLDLETTGRLRTGSIIMVLGMAYKHDGGMFTELLFARNPQEEKTLLDRYYEMLGLHDTVVTFNGDSFDIPFIQERSNAHLIRYKAPQNHVDMYKQYARIARSKHYPTATLQTYERTELGLVRKGDIPGSLIPQAYKDFINGIDDHTVRKIIDHNHLDLISLAIMYDQYHNK